ncbi:GNAT family N-acetyltransferase [Alicyclobacillus fastidiosus]|uniref:GNAT family N-acetyltransferase n=1 Tax=Alicyclobacillus fastidiosus TaxID=392011 RepID=UPI0034DD0B40
MGKVTHSRIKYGTELKCRKSKPQYSDTLLEEDNEPLGYAWIELRHYPQNAFIKERRALFVHQISIVDNQKRRGYGTALMNYIYELAKKKVFKQLNWITGLTMKWLRTFTKNTDSLFIVNLYIRPSNRC